MVISLSTNILIPWRVLFLNCLILTLSKTQVCLGEPRIFSPVKKKKVKIKGRRNENK